MEPRNLSTALNVLNDSLSIQTERLNIVANNSITASTSQNPNVAEISETNNFGTSSELIENSLKEQSITLARILDVNESMFEFFKKNRSEEERKSREESVSDEEDSTDSGSENNKKMFAGLRKAISDLRESLPNKKGIFDKLKMAGLAALVMTYADDFVEGFVETVFGEEAAQKVRSFADKYLNTETIATTALGVFFGGLKGGLLMFMFSTLRQALVKRIEETSLEEYLGEGSANIVGTTLAGIAVAMLTKTGRSIAKAIAKAAIRLPAMIPGLSRPTPGTETAPRTTPSNARQNPANEGPGRNQPSPSQRQQVSQMSDADLERQGVRRETRQVGRRGTSVRYRDVSTGRFISQADVASRSGAGGLGEAARRFPRFGMMAKVLGPLGFAVALADIASILMNDDMDKKQKQVALSRSISSILGGVGGAAAGGALGTLVFPGVGTILGGALGGIGGALLGDEIASQVAPWLFGESADENKVQKLTEDQLNQPPKPSSGSSFSTEYNGPVRATVQPSAVTPAETKMQMLERGAIDYAMGGGSSVSPINTNINNGGNVTNNNVGGASNVTYNIMSRPDRALAGNVPISPTAGSFG